MAGIALRHNSKAELFIVMTSVQDDAIPTDMNSVYAHLILSGWRIAKQETGIRIIYVTQIGFNGHLPAA